VVGAFVKKELTEKWAPAHNISGMRQHHTTRLSTYAYAFKDGVMKKCGFYMPGSTPKEIVSKVRDYAKAAMDNGKDNLVETDFSRFDATMSPFLRQVEFQCYLRYFGVSHVGELKELLDDEINLTCYGQFGTIYQQGSGRCSGSPLTTEGNTIVNSFVAYVAYRRAGFDSSKAFSLIGPKYGDDGIDDGRGQFESASRALGLTLKIVKPGNNVAFLGRKFVDVSIYDTTYTPPLKVLQRVPVVLRTDRPKEALTDRVNGYLVTENHVPLVGNYLRALKRIYVLGESVVSQQTEHDIGHRLKRGPYPYGPESQYHDGVLHSAIACELGMSVVEMEHLCHLLDAASCVKDLEDIKIISKVLDAPLFDMYTL
jgi:hypothetical protein